MIIIFRNQQNLRKIWGVISLFFVIQRKNDGTFQLFDSDLPDKVEKFFAIFVETE